MSEIPAKTKKETQNCYCDHSKIIELKNTYSVGTSG